MGAFTVGKKLTNGFVGDYARHGFYEVNSYVNMSSNNIVFGQPLMFDKNNAEGAVKPIDTTFEVTDFAGFSVRDVRSVKTQQEKLSFYKPNEPVAVMIAGHINVYVSKGNPKVNDDVYIITKGTNIGQIVTQEFSDNALRISNCSFTSTKDSNNIAVIKVFGKIQKDLGDSVVTSVNGLNGDVILNGFNIDNNLENASDVGTKQVDLNQYAYDNIVNMLIDISDLYNQKQNRLNAGENIIIDEGSHTISAVGSPVTSVNGMIGDVVIKPNIVDIVTSEDAITNYDKSKLHNDDVVILHRYDYEKGIRLWFYRYNEPTDTLSMYTGSDYYVTGKVDSLLYNKMSTSDIYKYASVSAIGNNLFKHEELTPQAQFECTVENNGWTIKRIGTYGSRLYLAGMPKGTYVRMRCKLSCSAGTPMISAGFNAGQSSVVTATTTEVLWDTAFMATNKSTDTLLIDIYSIDVGTYVYMKNVTLYEGDTNRLISLV